MTAKTDLLPLPSGNVAHLIAAQSAEIEALRAEVEAWRELSDHVRAGACKAIWPDRYTDERTRDVAAALKRAERLAEALREARDAIEDWAGYASDYFREKHDLAGDLAKIDALLRDLEEGK